MLDIRTLERSGRIKENADAVVISRPKYHV